MDNPLIRIEPGLFIWSILTFILLLTILTRFVWKPLTEALDRREERIRQSLDDAEKARREAERISKEYSDKIARAREEVQLIITEGKVTSEKLTKKMHQEAKEKSEQIRLDAEKQIQAEKENAVVEIRKEVVNLSLQAASKIIGRNLTRDDNLSVIEESIKKMDKTNA